MTSSPPSSESPGYPDQVLSDIDLDGIDPSSEPNGPLKRGSNQRNRRATAPNGTRFGKYERNRILAWATLLLPMAWLLWLTATFDRDSWPSLVGDEAVYLMAAQSIAWDGDLRYTDTDLERFEQQLGRSPEGLILQSPDAGKTMLYGKSWLYPLAIAPFAKVSATEGYAFGNAFYLLLASLATAWSLSTVLGRAAPLFVSAFIFGSLTFAHVFWAHSDLLLMSLVAIACSLILRPWLIQTKPRRLSLGAPTRSPKRPLRGGWAFASLATGCVLLAAVVVTRPYYAPILLIPLISTDRWKRFLLAIALITASLAGLLATNLAISGEWSPYVGHREAFYSYTGFPTTATAENSKSGGATPASTAAPIHPAWAQAPGEEPDNSWIGDGLFPFPFEPHQFGWNTLYLFLGRHTGLFPYFLPFLLGLFAFRSDRVNWYLLFALVSIMALFLYQRPFNYYGGGGALGNRYFLPIYPLFWFLIRRNISWRWPVILTAAAALTLLPKWTHPASFWRSPSGAFTHVSWVSERFLPYETTQAQLKPANSEDINYKTPNGELLWLKPLSPRITTPDQGKTLLLSPGPTRAEVVVATEKPQRAFRIEARGKRAHTALFARPSARHRMWWTFKPLYLYRFTLDNGKNRHDKPHEVTITPIAKRESLTQ